MNNGGPAFPSRVWVSNGLRHEGMTLRDYFAAAALTGDLAASVNARDRPEPNDLVAYAYCVADAMLAAREATDD